MTSELLCDCAIGAMLTLLAGLLLSACRRWLTRILLTLGVLGCLQSWCGPARAGELEDGMRVLCGTRGLAVARLSARHADIVDPLMVGAVVASESGCHAHAVSAGGLDIGYGQLRIGGSAARHHGRAALLQPALNIRLTAEHLRRCLDLCDGWISGALSVYRGIRRCVDSRGSRRVLDLYRRAKTGVAKSAQARK